MSLRKLREHAKKGKEKMIWEKVGRTFKLINDVSYRILVSFPQQFFSSPSSAHQCEDEVGNFMILQTVSVSEKSAVQEEVARIMNRKQWKISSQLFAPKRMSWSWGEVQSAVGQVELVQSVRNAIFRRAILRRHAASSSLIERNFSLSFRFFLLF